MDQESAQKCILCQEVLNEGIEKHVCDKEKKCACPFYFVGCKKEFTADELVIHIRDGLMEHLQFACTGFVKTKEENEKLKLQVKDLQ
jgi:hypothetical protein